MQQSSSEFLDNARAALLDQEKQATRDFLGAVVPAMTASARDGFGDWQELRSHVRQIRDHALDNPLHMHPDDISERNLKSGVEVQVKTEYGTIIATVRADATLRPGVVAMTHGWGHGGNRRLSVASNHPGTNVNAILPTGPGSFDPLSNMSFMTGVPVEVSQVA